MNIEDKKDAVNSTVLLFNFDYLILRTKGLNTNCWKLIRLMFYFWIIGVSF